MKVKNDHKVIMAIRDGLKDGILNYCLALPPSDKYYTIKESKAYRAAFQIAHRDDFVAVWKKTSRDLGLLDYAILKGDIVPVGWQISKTLNGGWFIE